MLQERNLSFQTTFPALKYWTERNLSTETHNYTTSNPNQLTQCLIDIVYSISENMGSWTVLGKHDNCLALSPDLITEWAIISAFSLMIYGRGSCILLMGVAYSLVIRLHENQFLDEFTKVLYFKKNCHSNCIRHMSRDLPPPWKPLPYTILDPVSPPLWWHHQVWVSAHACPGACIGATLLLVMLSSSLLL